MKLEFRDNIKRDAIDLYFEIKDDEERDITFLEAEINWSLTLQVASWGIETFNYELSLLRIPIDIDTVLDNGTIDNTRLYAEVKFNSKRNKKNYICRIYEDILENEKWIEEEYVQFPIDLVVEEKPANDSNNRSQIFVKYLELDLREEQKKLTLTI
jgi:hypothetical protein|tara:strand:- start:7076 stop:7543 length:468 start_codon:yes stop_codon:yes gene_type:complete